MVRHHEATVVSARTSATPAGGAERGVTRRTLWLAGLSGGVPLAVYLLTLVREPEWGDSAELALQAFRLGVTHPPGAPFHTLLVGLVVKLGGDPAIVGNLVSAFASAAAAMLVGLAVHDLTRKPMPSMVAAWMFGFVHPIWTMAVVTELYALSACLLALTLIFLLRDKPWAAGAAFTLALGAYRPNALLLLPAALLASQTGQGSALRRSASFLLPAVCGGVAWVVWDVMRSRVAPPLGSEFTPDRWPDVLRFLSAAQYIDHPPTSPSFYFHRILDHAIRLGRYLLGVGLVAAAVGFRRLPRHLAMPFAVWLIATLGYFTFHPYQDYFLMPHAAYIAIAVLAGCGLATIDSAASTREQFVRLGICAAMIAIPLGLVAVQFGRLRERSVRQEVTTFVLESFEALPQGAVVFSRWERFTTLRYFQEVHGLRRDLLLLERQEKMRRYGTLSVPGWRPLARSELGKRVVIIDGPATPELREPPHAMVLTPLSREPSLNGTPSPWERVLRVR